MERYVQILKQIENLEFSEENFVEVIYLLDAAVELSKSAKDLNESFKKSRSYVSYLLKSTEKKSLKEVEKIFKETIASLYLDIELHFCSANYEDFQMVKKKMGVKNNIEETE
jgi:hypothetical protein